MRKIHRTKQLTFVELMVGVTVVALALITLLTMFVPYRRQRTSATRISSINSLKQDIHAPAIRAGDYRNKFGKDVSSTNTTGSAMP